MQGTRVRSLGQEDALEKEMATHSSMLAWKITRTEEPGRLQSMRSQTGWLNNRQDRVFGVNELQWTSVSPWIHDNVSHLIAPNKVLSRWWGLVAKSCSTLCDPMNCSPRGCSVHGISQASILEWVAISFSRGSSLPRDQTQVSCLAGGFFSSEPSWKPPFHISSSHIQYHPSFWMLRD